MRSKTLNKHGDNREIKKKKVLFAFTQYILYETKTKGVRD